MILKFLYREISKQNYFCNINSFISYSNGLLSVKRNIEMRGKNEK